MKQIENLWLWQKVLLLLVVVGISVSVGFSLGFLVLRSRVPEMPSPFPQREGPKIATMSGTIRPLEVSLHLQGTHRLLDDEGKLLALLESETIDLKFFEGQKVEVEGKLSKTVEGGEKIIKVEKVRIE